MKSTKETASANIESIKKALEEKNEELRQFGVRRLALFGSAVHGQLTPKSDLDFLVELDPKSFGNFMGLRCFLEDLFCRRIDLVTPEALRPELRETILGESIDAACPPPLYPRHACRH